MAAAHSATTTTSFPIHFTTTTQFSRKSLLISCISTPKRHSNRKNYLRQKLRKTLTKPYPNPLIQPLTPTNSDITLLPPPEDESNFPSSDQFPGEPSPTVTGEEVKELEREEGEQLDLKKLDLINEESEQSKTSASVEVINGNVGKFPKSSFLKYGWWLLGAFVFQTICAVWVFGSADFDKKNENLENKKEKIIVNNVLEVSLNGNDESRSTLDDEMMKKIEEIKVMAREVREKEKMERKNDGDDGNESDSEDEEDIPLVKSEIEMKVKERLDKLRNRLEKNVKKSPMANLKGDGEKNNGLDEKLLGISKENVEIKDGLDEELLGILKEHVKRKNDLDEKLHVEYVKGDDEINDENGLDNKKENEKLVFKKKYKFKGSMSEERSRPKGFSGNGNTRRKQGKGVDVAESELPKVQDRNYGGALFETGDSKCFSNNGTLKSGSESNKKQDCDTEWWLSLPYIYVVLMQRGSGQQGLYTLKGDGLSHIIAFADRGDVTNFCYLLESFFEDLGDFSAEIVPLSVKELKEEITSESKKVIVVKKGELQLYAGQPLADVEMALRLLDQS